MAVRGLGIIDVVDERLEKRTWHSFNGRWFLDGEPVSLKDRRAYLRSKRKAASKARRK